jgi:transposase
MRQKIPRGPMPKQLPVSPQQEANLQKIIRRSQSPQSLVTRAKIVLKGAQFGRRNQQIAQELGTTNKTVRKWRARWLQGYETLEAVENEAEEKESLMQTITQLLSDQPRSGVPATFTAEQICQIIAVACELPTLSNRPITEWTPRELADEVILRKIVVTISASQVRLFLKRSGAETAPKPLLAQ